MDLWNDRTYGQGKAGVSSENNKILDHPSTDLGQEMEKSRAGVLNKSLAVSLSIPDSRVGGKDVEEVVKIICDPEFDAKLFSKQVTSVKVCHKIRDDIVSNFVNETEVFNEIIADCSMENRKKKMLVCS